jgi:membrane-bound lytic murein transglycosylase D
MANVVPIALFRTWFLPAGAVLLLLLTACATTSPKSAKVVPDVSGVAEDPALAAADLPVVTPADPVVEEVEGGEDAGIVDLVVQEPWPAPGEWNPLTGVPMDGEAPVEKGVALSAAVSLRFPEVDGKGPLAIEPEVVGVPIGPVKPAWPAGATDGLPVHAADDPLDDVSYDMPIEVNEAVRVYLEYFQTRMRPTFARYLIRSGRYIPEMKRILRKRGLPEDLAYVALIESGFNPYAYSRSRASGPWQFIASTGKRYGLRQDYWVDERREVDRATEAAADYLSDLYRRFGDWLLAMAAYNAGEGQVASAMKRTGLTNFWELREAYALPQETRDYVPKFMAAAIIAKNPEEYGFQVAGHDPMNTEMVEVDGPTDLGAIAKATGVPLEEIKSLNPHLRRGLTPPDNKPFDVRVPAGTAERFAETFPAIKKEEEDLWARKASNLGSGYLVRHKVRRGESLSLIASRYRARVSNIQQANNMGRRTMIRVGQVLLVPVGRGYAAADSGAKQVQHRVRRGDSLWKIAMRYNVRVKDLMAWNGLNPKSILRPGDRIIVKTGG